MLLLVCCWALHGGLYFLGALEKAWGVGSFELEALLRYMGDGHLVVATRTRQNFVVTLTVLRELRLVLCGGLRVRIDAARAPRARCAPRVASRRRRWCAWARRRWRTCLFRRCWVA